MKSYFSFLFFFFSFFAICQIQHCGYDFTSYIVVNAHENGVIDNPKDLKITIVTENGKEVINVNNIYSWNLISRKLVTKLKGHNHNKYICSIEDK